MTRDVLVYNKICEAINIIDEIDNLISTQGEESQKVEQEIQDWLHYIENNEINENESINIINQLKELRIIRRTLKKEYEIEKKYKDNASKMMGNNTRDFLKTEINKTINNLDSEYKNRILNEEKIVEILSKKKKKVGRPKK